ncbi:MAG: hypothetical protein J6N21_05445 [Butyrivibrio sp.]|nr:hypothetical protein [Butyrivibrio sp.]
MNCFGSHSGPGNGYNMGGSKCSQCQTGWLHLQHGIRSDVDNSRPTSKLDEYLLRARGQKQTPISPTEEKASIGVLVNHDEFSPHRSSNKVADGIILTNTRLIANKYKNTTSQDVLGLIQEFAAKSFDIQGFQWELIDLGAKDMDGALEQDASWIDYAQLLSDYADGVGMEKSANTPLFIIGGSDVIPMPDFYASIGHDIKTIEDSDLLYCFPIDYAWKRVSIKDAIFNVARLPLDYVGKGTLDSTIEQDLGAYFQRALDSLEYGIPFTYAMMTSNSGKTDRNDWTWTSADVMAKLPQQQLGNDGVLTKDNMFLCPTLDVLGEEYLSNENVEQYKHHLEKTDMLFINLHGSPNKSMSGYLGAENQTAYWGMTTELMKLLQVPIINAFPCYGARYGQYYFDNNDGSVSDYEVYDREDSMLLTAFYESNVLLFTGSCTCSMCSNVIGSGSATDHINESVSAVDLLMPAGYAEAMLKLYACYLIQGEPAGYALLHAKIDYLNYRAKYENKDLVFLTLNQFNLFGCPTLFLSPQDVTRQLKESFKSFSVEPKELPDVNYKTEFDRFEQGIDGVLNRARLLVDNNLKLLDEKVRTLLYDKLGLDEDNLTRIESVEYNGQQSYNLTYSKKNQMYPEFYIVQTDKNGNIIEVLESM